MAKVSSKKGYKFPLEKSEEIAEKIGEESNNESYYNDGKILSISTWSKILSWVVLVNYMGNFLAGMVKVVQTINQDANADFSPMSISGIIYWTNLLDTPLIGLTFFLVLQAISQGILILMDIEEKKS